MKRLTLLTGMIITLVISSCSTTKNSTSREQDDRYFSLADAKKERRQAQKLVDTPAEQPGNSSTANPDYSSNTNPSYQQIPDASQGTYSSNQNNAVSPQGSYDMDENYDYMYASRIRRFQRPVHTYGYYDPFYTNMYWYNYDPFSYGTSIYTTSNFFNPYVPWGNPGISFGWNSWGGSYFNYGYNPYAFNNPYSYYNPWRWNSWGYNPYGCSPFAYNPFSYSPYGYGYGAGYNNGYMNGMLYSSNSNSTYYNSYDSNSHYYGPNTGGAGSGGSSHLNQTFTNQIGTNYASVGTVYNPNGGKYAPVTSANATVDKATQPVQVGGKQVTPVANQVGGTVKKEAVVNGKNITAKPTSADKYTSVGGATQQQQAVTPQKNTGTIANPTAATQVNTGKNSTLSETNAPIQQQGRAGLIQSGSVQSATGKPAQPTYNSAPSVAKSTVAENSPAGEFRRQPNIAQQPVAQPGVAQPGVAQPGVAQPGVAQPTRANQQRPTAGENQGTVQSAPYRPNYDYNNGVRSTEPIRQNSTTAAPANGTQQSQPVVGAQDASRNTYQQTQPQRNNYQNYSTPQPSRNSNSTQQGTAPRNNSTPQQQRNTYQNTQPQRDYSTPQQQNSNPNTYQQRNTAPAQQPANLGRQDRHTAPRQEQPRQAPQRMDSSPRGNPGGGAGNGGGRVNSPRR